MKIINFFGGAGSGKSAQAAGLFWKMKEQGYSVELINEFPKQIVWEKHFSLLSDQLYIFANQNRQVLRLEGQVDYCITDSPTLLSIAYKDAYSASPYTDALDQLVLESYERNENINFYMERPQSYDTTGRAQNEEESIRIDKKIRCILHTENIKYKSLNFLTQVNILDDMLEYVKHESRFS